mmetsp:Transcript_8939/g.24813  ORF Transcript_8939/g.24813 Transcript_8939/m.24813 type:complete len:275 (-) Transcript_8939:683-1507(-)
MASLVNLCPIQMCGPNPKGRKARLASGLALMLSGASSIHRSGKNSSGLGKSTGLKYSWSHLTSRFVGPRTTFPHSSSCWPWRNSNDFPATMAKRRMASLMHASAYFMRSRSSSVGTLPAHVAELCITSALKRSRLALLLSLWSRPRRAVDVWLVVPCEASSSSSMLLSVVLSSARHTVCSASYLPRSSRMASMALRGGRGRPAMGSPGVLPSLRAISARSCRRMAARRRRAASRALRYVVPGRSMGSAKSPASSSAKSQSSCWKYTEPLSSVMP